MDLIEVSENQNRHPWELSRIDCIFKEVKKLGDFNTVLDIGCGDGYFDERLLEEFDNIKSLYGVDIYLEKPYSSGKGCWTNSFDDISGKKFDIIFMMDVLEHIEDDKGFMKRVYNMLNDDGRIVFTVPAFMRLFSLHDEELKHFRRYDRHMLKDTLSGTGLKITDQSYFYFCLIILRLLTWNKTENLSMWENDESSLKTKLVRSVLNCDYSILRFFSKFKIYIGGLSLLAIIEKEKDAS